MEKKIILFLAMLLFNCYKFPANPLESDEDLKHTPEILRIEPDSDYNLVLYIDYSYSEQCNIIVERKTKGGFEQVSYEKLSQTTLVDTSFNKELDNNFIYRVFIEKGDLRSDYSAEKSYGYVSSTLNAPQSLRINVLELQGNEITWIDRSGKEEGFKLEKHDGSGWQELATLPANAQKYMHSISGIPSLPMPLSYRVQAFNSGLSSPWAEISTTYTGIGVPTNLHIIDTTAYRFTIEWTDNSNIETGYVVERNKNGSTFSEIAHVNANVVKYIDKIIEAGSYGFRVRAKKDAMYSSYSNKVLYHIKIVLPTEGLVAFYPFNGNALDESGNGNNGTVYGATLNQDRFLTVNSAYSFDGDDYISIADANILDLIDNFTLAVWIMIDEYRRLGGIISKYNEAAANGYTLRLSYDSYPHNKIDFCNLTASTILSLNKWYFIAVRVESGYAKIYINDINVHAEALAWPMIANSCPLTIGQDYLQEFRTFKGNIDDILIYNRLLTDSEIHALYYEGGWGN